jgi:hypothetical protein
MAVSREDSNERQRRFDKRNSLKIVKRKACKAGSGADLRPRYPKALLRRSI